jgi:myo-inositol-1(or 4)-monophosphatase
MSRWRHLLESVIESVVSEAEILVAQIPAIERYGYSAKSSIGDLTTDLDREIETSLSSKLLKLIPDSRVIGEEFGSHGIRSHEWIVDPVDGTTNVVHGMNHAAICVALTVGSRPQFGVVHNPFARRTYYAILGDGSYVRHHDSATIDRRLHVSGIDRLNNSLIGFGLPYDRSRAPQIFSAAAAAFAACQDLRRRGSASLDIVSIAEGTLDGHFELDLRVWDVAAAGLILKEAGGVITTWEGDELNWVSSDLKLDVVASNRAIHKELSDTVRSSPRLGSEP